MPSHLTFANVCSVLALVVALGTGGAYAAATVRSSDIVDGQVKAVDLRDGAVTSSKIRDGAVAAPDLAVGAVDSGRTKDGSLTGADLADQSVTSADLADGSVGAGEIGNGAVASADVEDNSLTFSDIVGGVATGNLSISAGAVANGRCQGFNIAVGGSQAGDAVVFSVQEAMQDGVFWYGVLVPSDGIVRAQLCNLSGGTLSAITDLQVRILTFR